MLTLQEAIVEVLSIAGEAMTARDIAAEVNQLGHYARRDGLPVPANQISARVNKYSYYFTRSDGLIGLQHGSPTNPALVRPPRHAPNIPGSAEPLRNNGESTRLAPLAGLPFRDVGVIGELLTTGLPPYDWLDRSGVYALILPLESEVSFLDADRARKAGNVISPWEVDRLRGKWVDGTRVVYIGLAGDRSQRSLRERLRDLLNHCAGKISVSGPHKGGEIIWQFAAYDSLLLRAMATGNPPEPRDTERRLLAAFGELHGTLPFANRKG